MDNSSIEFSFGNKPDETGIWPLRLAVIAEFLPRVYETGRPETRSFRSRIDKEDFNSVMTRAGLRLQFDMNNPLTDQPKELNIDLTINDLKAFRPEYIVEQVPILKNLIGVRGLLGELLQRKVTIADFKNRLGDYQLFPDLSDVIGAALRTPEKPAEKPHKPSPLPRPAKEPPQKGGGLDSILDMVDMGGDSSPDDHDASGRVQAAIDDYLGTGPSGVESVNVRGIQHAISTIDTWLSRAVNRILHHSEFQRLEAVWRGLKYLVDQTDFRKEIQLEILHADKNQLKDVFTKNIYQVEYDGHSEVPLAATVAAFEFDANSPDIELLREMAELAGEIPLVIVSSLGAPFFGLDTGARLSELPLLTTLLASPDYTKFDGLRSNPSSRWLALGYNRFLLRYPYGHEGLKVKSFDLKESAADEADYLWGNPVWALVSLMTRSFARLAWATEISGRRNEGMLENLPVRAVALPNGDTVNITVEALVPDRRLEEFDRSGIIPLLGDINTDVAYLLAAPSVHRPLHDSDPRKAEMNALMSSLPYQMYAGTIARFINRKFAELVSGGGAAEIEVRFARALAAFNTTRDGAAESDLVNVRVSDSEMQPGQRVLVISVMSPRQVMHGRAGVNLALPLRS